MSATPDTDRIPSFDALSTALDAASSDPAALDALWTRLVRAGQVPFIAGDTVVFLYKGAGDAVAWRGDFTGWSQHPDLPGRRVGNSDLWLLAQNFPQDARVEYKIVIDGKHAILDPANALQQEGGIEIRSVVAMPDYRFSPYTTPDPKLPAGTLSPFQMTVSKALDYALMYRVYTPSGYESLADLPVVYVTDGQDYAAPGMGGMVAILDNLIGQGWIRPLIAVLIDPRDPDDLGKNRRESELWENTAYAEFVAGELVPLIDRRYRTARSPQARAILGASLGGWNALFFGLTRPQVFGLVGMHSPAIVGENPLVNRLMQQCGLPQSRYFLSAGRPEFADDDVSGVVEILAAAGVAFKALIVNEGHSYGQWSRLLVETLLYFFGK